MKLRGVGVGRGVVVGTLLSMPDPLPDPPASQPGVDPVPDRAAEKTAVQAAVAAVSAELQDRADRAEGDGRAVIEAAIQMVRDPALAEEVDTRIDDGATGERAVYEALLAFQTKLVALGGHMAERAADVADVSQRMIAQLRGVPVPGVPESDTPFVLMAGDLAPADTALLDLDKVLGIVTRGGGPTSHTSILARSRSIPAIVGVGDVKPIADGTRVILDAAAGVLTIDPSDKAVAAAKQRPAKLKSDPHPPATEAVLADGTKVPLLANLGSLAEADDALKLGAEGVGLFRTEFLFLNAKTAPTVKQQQAAYIELLKLFGGKKVIVRVLDIGADKTPSFVSGDHEVNPALGVRGLRALRSEPHLLHDQLTALKAAQDATDADLWVMAPMVADAEEARFFVEYAKQLGLSTVGVMAEVPSLALLAEQVFEVADFVSIGTNDLTQYALAADRALGATAGYQDPWHPAVLRLVKMLGDAGAAAGKPVGVCGEAASDPLLAVVLVGLGATTLSMTSAALAEVRAELAKVTPRQAKAKARAALAASTAADARAAAAAAG